MGLAIRCCLIATWLALFSAHVWRFVLPGIGVVERHDLGAGLAQQIDRTLTYDIMSQDAGGLSKRLGSSELSVARDDVGFRCDLRFDLECLPGSSPTARTIHITASEKLDDRFRLSALTADGEVLGMSLKAKANVDYQGLTGSLQLAGKQIPFALPGFGGKDGAAMDLGIALPPGLKPGDRFKAKLLDIGITLLPIEREAVFVAESREMITTRGGPLELLKVVVSIGGKPGSTYWCDALGTVYRAELGNRSMALELVRIHQSSNQILWPTKAAAQ